VRLAGAGRLQALPQPELERAEADQDWVGGSAEAVFGPVLRLVPGEFPGLDQHEPRRRLSGRDVVHHRIGRKSTHVRQRRRVQRHRRRPIQRGCRRCDEGVVDADLAADRHLDARGS